MTTPNNFAPPPPPQPTVIVEPPNIVSRASERLIAEQKLIAEYHASAEFTRKEFMHLFCKSLHNVIKLIGDTKPVNLGAPIDEKRWRMSDVCKLGIASTKLSPADKLAVARTKVAEQDNRAKILQNDERDRLLIPDSEVEQHIAYAFKVMARWLDLLPDTFEKKAYIKGEQIPEFLKTIDKVKKQLQDDLTGL